MLACSQQPLLVRGWPYTTCILVIHEPPVCGVQPGAYRVKPALHHIMLSQHGSTTSHWTGSLNPVLAAATKILLQGCITTAATTVSPHVIGKCTPSANSADITRQVVCRCGYSADQQRVQGYSAQQYIAGLRLQASCSTSVMLVVKWPPRLHTC